MIRHFTSTGFVVHNDAILLHWHRKVREWLPAGGHIEPNEDPVQATVREVLEETGIEVKIIPTAQPLQIGNLDQVHTPFSVMVEDVFDQEHGKHQHIDFIYFTVPAATSPPVAPGGWHWVTRDQLESGATLESPDGRHVPPPEDVIKLGIAAIDHVGAYFRPTGR